MKKLVLPLLFAALFPALPASSQTAPAGRNAPATTFQTGLPNAVMGAAFFVSDIRRSIKFYRDGLGMTVVMKFGPADRPAAATLGFSPDPSKPTVMLLGNMSSSGPRKIDHGHAFDHLVLMMADLEAVSAKLKAAGFEPGKIMIVHGAARAMTVLDPDGYRVEIIDSNPPK